MFEPSSSEWASSKRVRNFRKLFLAAGTGYALFVGWQLFSWQQRSTERLSGMQVDWQQGQNLYRPYAEHPTVFVDGVPGYNVFRDLYLWKGVFYAITPDNATFPSNPSLLSMRPDSVTGRRESADESKWRVIGVEEARGLFGDQRSIRLGGTSLFLNDEESGPPRNMSSFLNHYFHLIAESFLGAWRLLAKIHAEETGSMSVAGMMFPTRIIFGQAEPQHWRDWAGLNTWFLNTIMPMTAIEEYTVSEDRARSGNLHVFDQIVLLDRFSATRTSPLARAWNKMAAELPNIPAPNDWWDPIRSNLFHAIGSPEMLEQRVKGSKAVVTYVSRQTAAHRRLLPADDADIVAALQSLADKGEIEFVHAIMEKMDRPDQFRLAARTDILVGIHGNGLSHQMWQRPGSDVIEIMDAGGFTRDYEILSELMQHSHYTVHNDVLFKRDQWYINEEKWQTVGQTKDFHGDNIRCNGQFVAQVVNEIVKRKYTTK